MKSIHHIISEDQVAHYFFLVRTIFWPNNHYAPAVPLRSEREKAETRKDLEEALLQILERKL